MNSCIICSGNRAKDLAIRLKYADFNLNQLIIDSDLKRAMESAMSALNGRLFILPTYTALLSIQKILARKKIKKYYWEEQS